MLPIRLGVVTAVATLCLWGLFSLLDSLQEPGLLRSQKAVVVKGCDTLDSEQASRECPALFCQKALIDSRQVALAATFKIELDEPREGARHLEGNAVSDSGAPQHFACEVRGNKVVRAEIVEDPALDTLEDD